MAYGICPLTIVPGRIEPSSKTEQVTQLLFGESFEILESNEKWLHVRCTHDAYSCWIEKDQHLPLSDEQYEALQAEPAHYTSAFSSFVTSEDQKTTIKVVAGSRLPHYQKGSFSLGSRKFTYADPVVCFDTPLPPSALEKITVQFEHAPYLWGGRSPYGIDCSGFMQNVFRLFGIALPRDAYQQAEVGTTLNLIHEAQAGDIAYFDNEEGRITHVGVILADNKIMHAAGRVRIDSLDHQGIFNVETQTYSHKLRIIKRVFE